MLLKQNVYALATCKQRAVKRDRDLEPQHGVTYRLQTLATFATSNSESMAFCKSTIGDPVELSLIVNYPL